jgi:hypothetical protein
MIRIGTTGAACLAIALATAAPAFAQGGHRGAGFHGSGYHGGNFRGGGYRGGGFGGAGILPGIAAGVIAGAVLGAGPGYYNGYSGYYDNTYAYDPGYPTETYPNSGYVNTYDPGFAARNGFVCQPGTLFRGEDGRNHLCQ